MANGETGPKTSDTLGEKGLRVGRDLNVLGAVAWGGAALVIPGPNVVLAGLAALDVAQAGGLEVWRRHLANKRVAKSS